MPTYNYKCTKCHNTQEELRMMCERDNKATCTKCGGKKTLSSPPVHTMWGEDKFAREHEVNGNGIRSSI